ncbi:isochorismatase family protein [Ferrimonas marina]|uniref:Nicotinamidase-related amidase n=1 Tax=Ferrimonas marina TaxID=299255 RepID=A0A1M5MP22_9GAMM|nr:isochorismatase family protein [Ferrimonas marina]SHG78513.1 Nicotinamidase-related amidase [Ferrimonas marina]
MQKFQKLATALSLAALLGTSGAFAAGNAEDGGDGLPNPGVTLVKGQTAIVITDPQIDFLSPKGVAWALVGKNVEANNTVENIERLMKIAGEKDIPLIISPHFYAPTDLTFKHGGALEHAMHGIKMFESSSRLDQDGFPEGSGVDWMPQYKKYINNGKTAVSTPHKVYGPDTNDTVLQLRKRNVSKIILAGMSANLCTESHMREFMEQGFEVMVVKDASAAAQLPDYDGYAAALVNWRMIANSVKTTDEVIKQINKEL